MYTHHITNKDNKLQNNINIILPLQVTHVLRNVLFHKKDKHLTGLNTYRSIYIHYVIFLRVTMYNRDVVCFDYPSITTCVGLRIYTYVLYLSLVYHKLRYNNQNKTIKI